MSNLHKYDIDITQLTEINLNINQNEEWDRIRATSQVIWGNNSINISQTPNRTFRKSNRGGTCTMVHGKLTAKVKRKGKD